MPWPARNLAPGDTILTDRQVRDLKRARTNGYLMRELRRDKALQHAWLHDCLNAERPYFTVELKRTTAELDCDSWLTAEPLTRAAIDRITEFLKQYHRGPYLVTADGFGIERVPRASAESLANGIVSIMLAVITEREQRMTREKRDVLGVFATHQMCGSVRSQEAASSDHKRCVEPDPKEPHG